MGSSAPGPVLFAGGGGGMEPATAPQADMAPELTPEEEQVSRASVVGVSHSWGLRRPLPAGPRSSRPGPRVASPWWPRPRPSSPKRGASGGRSGSDLFCLLGSWRLWASYCPSPQCSRQMNEMDRQEDW